MTIQKEIKCKSDQTLMLVSVSILDYFLKWQHDKSKRWHNSKHKITLSPLYQVFHVCLVIASVQYLQNLSSLVTPSKMLYKKKSQVLLQLPFNYLF